MVCSDCCFGSVEKFQQSLLLLLKTEKSIFDFFSSNVIITFLHLTIYLVYTFFVHLSGRKSKNNLFIMLFSSVLTYTCPLLSAYAVFGDKVLTRCDLKIQSCQINDHLLFISRA